MQREQRGDKQRKEEEYRVAIRVGKGRRTVQEWEVHKKRKKTKSMSKEVREGGS